MGQKGSFSDMGDAVLGAASAARKAAEDLADCVPAVERASKAFDRLKEAAMPLRPVPAPKEELLRDARKLAERAAWHLHSAQGCLIAGAIKKPERFLQAYRQLLQVNAEIGVIADEIEQRFPDMKGDIALIRESLVNTDRIATLILNRESDLPFVRSGGDGPGPKKPLS